MLLNGETQERLVQLIQLQTTKVQDDLHPLSDAFKIPSFRGG
jgi:hypothetical protein